MTTCMIKRLRNQWLKISLKKKLGIYAVMLSLVVGLSVICTIVAMNFVVNSFNTILEDNSRCHDFQEAMELEAKADPQPKVSNFTSETVPSSILR